MVLALFRGEDGLEDGDSIRVKERDVCRALGRPLRASVADMVAYSVVARTPQDLGTQVIRSDCGISKHSAYHAGILG